MFPSKDISLHPAQEKKESADSLGKKNAAMSVWKLFNNKAHQFWHYLYKRCFWGLRKISDTQVDHTDICQAGAESDDSIIELQNLIKTEHTIDQSIYSPDKKYILYCEIKYGHQGITDDEYCYYRVYEIETGKMITLYQGYRE